MLLLLQSHSHTRSHTVVKLFACRLSKAYFEESINAKRITFHFVTVFFFFLFLFHFIFRVSLPRSRRRCRCECEHRTTVHWHRDAKLFMIFFFFFLYSSRLLNAAVPLTTVLLKSRSPLLCVAELSPHRVESTDDIAMENSLSFRFIVEQKQ